MCSPALISSQLLQLVRRPDFWFENDLTTTDNLQLALHSRWFFCCSLRTSADAVIIRPKHRNPGDEISAVRALDIIIIHRVHQYSGRPHRLLVPLNSAGCRAYMATGAIPQEQPYRSQKVGRAF